MRLRIDVAHETTRSGGKALRAEDGDIDAFVCWASVPALVALDLPVPAQFTHAHFFSDFEVYDDGVLALHRERVFSSAARAKDWFRYLAWCLSSLSAEDMSKAASFTMAWRLT